MIEVVEINFDSLDGTQLGWSMQLHDGAML